MGQGVRDAVGTLLLQLTLKELFQWRFMQTDPNWGNFLYDAHSGVLHLIDFGERPPPRSASFGSLLGAPSVSLRAQALPHQYVHPSACQKLSRS